MKKKDYLDIIRYHASDILESDGMGMEKKFIQHGSVSVYDHSVSVAIECLKIAQYLNIPVDIRSLVRGSLLHDYFLYDWHISDKSHNWHGFTHANVALKNALKDFSLNDIEMNMIKCHMFPLNIIPPKYREGVLLCIADKIVATKETVYPYVVKLFGREINLSNN